MTTSEVDFGGTDRFSIVQKIGAGGMGVVYEVLDRERNIRVALKTLTTLDATAIYRFKQEFRSLAELLHPNLIQLYELVAHGDQWFFTMEFIEGTELLEFVRPKEIAESRETIDRPYETNDRAEDRDRENKATQDIADYKTDLPPVEQLNDGHTAPSTEDTGSIEASKSIPTVRRPIACDLDRLRDVLRQLALGICALHNSGKLHRDIKPSNVMVTQSGQVLLLDFGLVAEMAHPLDSDQSSSDTKSATESKQSHYALAARIEGTPGYMAPEQASRQPLTEASDWYAVGALLYEALTGRLPFDGSLALLLVKKQTQEPPPPSELIDGIPDDLNSLCIELLSRDPDRRPTGAAVLSRLSTDDRLALIEASQSASLDSLPFIGRTEHLEALNRAFDEMQESGFVTIDVHGRSGAGKSALSRRFLDDLVSQRQAVVLSGRCYENESVPYKAVDSLVDALTRFLLRLDENERQELMPGNLFRLARLFPVLRRVASIEKAAEEIPDIPDLQELRRQAFDALRELLSRLGNRQPLVLYIDDLQWGDVDSARLLIDLLRPPNPPKLLLLIAYRSEYDDTSLCLRTLKEDGRHGVSSAHVEVRVKALTIDETRELAQVLLVDAHPTAEMIEQIVRESGGSPYFVSELVKFSRTGLDLSRLNPGGQQLELDEALWMRAENLPADTRLVLEIVAVAGQPSKLRDIFVASGLNKLEPRIVRTLRSEQFVRTSGPGLDDEIESFHGRIRESTVSHLSAEVLQNHHRQLAEALKRSSDTDSKTIAEHLVHAGETEQAGLYYLQAGDDATNALAFASAAELYQRSLKCRPVSGSEHCQLRTKMADALANAGLSVSAAREYEAACGHAGSDELLELQRRAAYQYCISGYVEEGRKTLNLVLQRVGMKLPGSPLRAVVSMLASRTRLWFRGTQFVERNEDVLNKDELTRIDITWSASTGVSMFDIIVGADFQTRNLLLALKAGEPYRVARGLAWEASHNACAGTSRHLRQSEKLANEAGRIAERIQHPHALGMAQLAPGIVCFLGGQWSKSLDHLDRAETIFRERCTGVAWELDSTQIFRLWNLMYMGAFEDLVRQADEVFAAAVDRGDLYASTTHATYALVWARLCDDAPEEARRVLSENLGKWTNTEFQLQHLLAVFAQSMIHLYCGDANAAWQHLDQYATAAKRSQLLRVRLLRGFQLSYRARSLIAAAAVDSNPNQLLKNAHADTRRLERTGMSFAFPFANLNRAGIAAIRSDNTTAQTRLKLAAQQFDTLGMHSYAASTRVRIGEFSGGDAGRVLVQDAHEWFREQGVSNPDRMVEIHAPGFKYGSRD